MAQGNQNQGTSATLTYEPEPPLPAAPQRAHRFTTFEVMKYWDRIIEWAEKIAKAGIGCEEIRGDQAKVLTVILRGLELGIGPMQAVQHIRVIHGNTSLSSALVQGLALRDVPGARIVWLKDGTSGVARVRCERPGYPPVEIEASLEDLRARGVTRSPKGGEKSVWVMYPADMLCAFVVRRACARQFPETMLGFDTAVDEADDTGLPAPALAQVPHAASALPVGQAAPALPVATAQTAATVASGLSTEQPTIVSRPAPVVDRTLGGQPVEAAAYGQPVSPPGDMSLGFDHTDSPYAGKTMVDLRGDEFQTFVDGYIASIERASTPEKKQQREAQLAAVLEWARFRGVTVRT